MVKKVIHGVLSAPARLDPGMLAARPVAIALTLLVSVEAHAWFPSFSEPQPEKPTVAWSYQGDDGPASWGRLSEDFAPCREGGQQSPIDIRQAKRMAFEPLSFHYRSAPLDLVFDGRLVRGRYAPGSYLMTGGHRYELKAFEFHVPAEHHIQGRRADMEMQLIHQDAQGRAAIVAVLMRIGRRQNSMLRRIWRYLPEQSGQQVYDRQAGINPVFLLPARRDYFVYSGSLTTPPCTDGIDWMVMREPLEIDAEYIRRMQAIVGRNARPVQAADGRSVLGFLKR